MILGLILLASISRLGNGEVYSSASDMKEVFRLERELVSIMNNFAHKLQNKLEKINSYLEVRNLIHTGSNNVTTFHQKLMKAS